MMTQTFHQEKIKLEELLGPDNVNRISPEHTQINLAAVRYVSLDNLARLDSNEPSAPIVRSAYISYQAKREIVNHIIGLFSRMRIAGQLPARAEHVLNGIDDYANRNMSGIELDSESVQKDIALLVEYGKILITLDITTRMSALPEVATDFSVVDKAKEVMERLPLANDTDNRLAHVLQYAKIVGEVLSRGKRFRAYRDALTDKEKLPQIIELLLNPDKVSSLRDSVKGVPIPYSGAVYVAPSYSDADSDGQGACIKAYSFFAREENLLKDSIADIIPTLSKGKAVTLTDIGVGAEKFSHVVKGFKDAGYDVGVNLVDLSSLRLREAADYLRQHVGVLEPHFVESRFEDLETSKFRISPEGPSLACYFGTTFCNHEPFKNFEFFRSTGSRYVLVGIYHLPEGKTEQEAMVAAYNTEEMREHTKPVGKLMGLTDEDLDERCSFKTELMTENWCLRYQFKDEQPDPTFKDVRVVVPYFEAREEIRTPFITYQPGDTIAGLRSVKFTPAQIRAFAQRSNFAVLEEYVDKDITLYLMEDLNHKGDI